MVSTNEMRGTTVTHNSDELKAAAKGVKDTDKAGSKSFGFIQFKEHGKDDVTNKMKKQLCKERSLWKKMRSSW